MKLSDLLSKDGIISVFEDIQLVSMRTGKCLTDVTYLEGGSPANIDELNANMNNEVVGISACLSDKKDPYIRIMIKSEEGW